MLKINYSYYNPQNQNTQISNNIDSPIFIDPDDQNISNIIQFPFHLINSSQSNTNSNQAKSFQQLNKKLNSQQKEKYTGQQGHIPVQPIIGEDIQKAKDYLLNKTSKYHGDKDFSTRDYTMFTFGLNIGLRITDLLNIKISDIYKNGQIVEYMAIKEQKTINSKKPAREIIIIPEVQEILLNYINSKSMEGWKPDWYLFHAIHPKRTPYKAMTRQNVWHKMKDIEEELDSKVPFGTHTLRKSFARCAYDRLIEKDPLAIIVIQKMLCHSSPEITLAYIGITREKEISLRMEVGLI